MRWSALRPGYARPSAVLSCRVALMSGVQAVQLVLLEQAVL